MANCHRLPDHKRSKYLVPLLLIYPSRATTLSHQTSAPQQARHQPRFLSFLHFLADAGSGRFSGHIRLALLSLLVAGGAEPCLIPGPCMRGWLLEIDGKCLIFPLSLYRSGSRWLGTYLDRRNHPGDLFLCLKRSNGLFETRTDHRHRRRTCGLHVSCMSCGVSRLPVEKPA